MIAFTDGVVAILITILVLELKPPDGHHLSDILDEKGPLLAYLLSFIFVAIYWVNHHHLMQVVHHDRRPDALGEHRPPVLPLADPDRDRLARAGWGPDRRSPPTRSYSSPARWRSRS